MSSPTCQSLTVFTVLAGVVGVIQRLLPDTDGQDLVEYALLCAFVGLIGVAAWGLIERGLGEAYRGYDTAQQGLWEPDDPGTATPPSPAP